MRWVGDWKTNVNRCESGSISVANRSSQQRRALTSEPAETPSWYSSGRTAPTWSSGRRTRGGRPLRSRHRRCDHEASGAGRCSLVCVGSISVPFGGQPCDAAAAGPVDAALRGRRAAQSEPRIKQRSGISAAAHSRFRIDAHRATRDVIHIRSLVGRRHPVKRADRCRDAPSAAHSLSGPARLSCEQAQEAFMTAPQTNTTELQGNRQVTRFPFLLVARRTMRHPTAGTHPRTTRWTIGQCGHSGLRRASNT